MTTLSFIARATQRTCSRYALTPTVRAFSWHSSQYHRSHQKDDHLMEAVMHNQPTKVKHNLEKGASPNCQDSEVFLTVKV
jgi:hypothetical protein